MSSCFCWPEVHTQKITDDTNCKIGISTRLILKMLLDETIKDLLIKTIKELWFPPLSLQSALKNRTNNLRSSRQGYVFCNNGYTAANMVKSLIDGRCIWSTRLCGLTLFRSVWSFFLFFFRQRFEAHIPSHHGIRIFRHAVQGLSLRLQMMCIETWILGLYLWVTSVGISSQVFFLIKSS